MESIKSKDNASILLDLVKRVGNGDNAEGNAQSVNVISPAEVPIVKEAVIKNTFDWMSAETSIEVLEVESDCCNDGELTVLDLNRFVNLRELKVGDNCFANVNEVELIGLSKLERVVIGNNCFTQSTKDKSVCDPNHHFYAKDCERLRELEIGWNSFYYYDVCQIENMPSLEAVEMKGTMFYHASLQLKSASHRMK